MNGMKWNISQQIPTSRDDRNSLCGNAIPLRCPRCSFKAASISDPFSPYAFSFPFFKSFQLQHPAEMSRGLSMASEEAI